MRKYTKKEIDNTILIISLIQIIAIIIFLPFINKAPSFIRFIETLNVLALFITSFISTFILINRYIKIFYVTTTIQFLFFVICIPLAKYNHPFINMLLFLNLVNLFFKGMYYLGLVMYNNSPERVKLKPTRSFFKTSHIDEGDQSIYDSTDKIKEYFPSINSEKELLDDLFNRFLKVEQSLSDGDLESLKTLCTDSLYDMLSQQYKTYASRGERHVVDSFQLYSYNIQSIDLDNQSISIKMSLHVANADYYSDLNGHYLRGKTDHLKHSQYILEFVIDQEKKMICPNCGSRVSNETCEYCHTVFKDIYYDFTLAKIGLFQNQTK